MNRILAFTRSTTAALALGVIEGVANGGSIWGSVSVSIATATSGASIDYTTDGSIPTQSSTPHAGAMNLTNSATVKAKAFKSGYNASSRAAASFTIAAAPPPPTSGNIYYVAKTGSNSYSCAQAKSTSTPKLSITSAVSCLAPGDTLMIRAGTYLDSYIRPPGGSSETDRVIIRSYPGETVIIKTPTGTPPDYLFDLTTASQSYVTIDGLILDGDSHCDGCGAQYGLWIENARYVRIQNSEVRDIRSIGVAVYGGPQMSQFVELLNLNVHHNGYFYSSSAPTLSRKGHGLYMSSSDNLVDGGSYHDNAGHGMQSYMHGGAPNRNVIRNGRWYGNRGGPGIGAYWGQNLKVYNNLVYNNQGGGIRINTRNSLFSNNTLYNNSSYGILVDNSGNTFVNNIAYLNGSGNIQNDATNNLTNNIVGTDPKFVNAGAGDFRLQSTSPAINAGTTISEVTNDITGLPRPRGSAYDIGAHEY